MFSVGSPQGDSCQNRGGSKWGATEAIASPKTYEHSLIHHDVVQFRKQHWRC